MVAMVVLCGIKIRYTHLLVHLVTGNLVDIVEEGGKSSYRCYHGVKDHVQSMHVTSLRSKEFGSIQEFNGGDFGSRVLELRKTCTKTSQLSTTTSDQL
jgi:hypothetical protein